MSALLTGALARQQSPALLQAARALCCAAVQPELWATEIKLIKGKTLEVAFNTGECFSLPAEYLRVESPAAGNLDAKDAAGRPKVVHGRRHVGIMQVEPVGSYAVRLAFDDMHSTGIFTWQYLHDLGSHKLSRMRRYLRTLKQRGFSRDPPALQRRKRAEAASRDGTGSSSGGAAGTASSGSGAGGTNAGGQGRVASGSSGASGAGNRGSSSEARTQQGGCGGSTAAQPG